MTCYLTTMDTIFLSRNRSRDIRLQSFLGFDRDL